MQNEEHDAAFFLFPMPRLREIRLAPPMPKKVCKRGHEYKQGHGYRCCRNLIRIVHLANEKCIRHVVNYGYNLTYNCRNGKRNDSSVDRHCCKRYSFSADDAAALTEDESISVIKTLLII